MRRRGPPRGVGAVAMAVLGLTLVAAPAARATAPGANGPLAYDSTTWGNTDVVVANADGSGAHRLTSDPHDDLDPSWSPDRSRLVFESTRSGAGDLYVMRAEGAGLHRLASSPSFDGFPSWSPDGSRVAFTSTRGGTLGIWTVHPDGARLRRLTGSEGECLMPSWSPDGRRIAMTCNRRVPPTSTSWTPTAPINIVCARRRASPTPSPIGRPPAPGSRSPANGTGPPGRPRHRSRLVTRLISGGGSEGR